MREAGHIGLAV